VAFAKVFRFCYNYEIKKYTNMAKAKKIIKKDEVEKDEEIDETKTKDGPIEIPEDDKAIDPDILAESEATALEESEEEEEDAAVLDEEEIDPFGDKWEQ
jgi:predicted small lipoprotein YifL